MTKIFSESFDPMTWPGAASFFAPARKPAAKTSASPRQHAMPLALAGALAVLAAGAGTAWLMRVPVDQANVGPALVTAPLPVPKVAPLQSNQVERTFVLATVADLSSALASAGMAPDASANVAALVTPGLAGATDLRATLRLSTATAVPTLLRLELSHPDGSGVVVAPDASGKLATTATAAHLDMRVIVRNGRMDAESFYSSAVAAGITDSLIADFAKALSFDFDFQREVGAGDAFEAAFSQRFNAHGDAVGAPVLLYASLTTSTKSASVYRFDGAPAAGSWFDSGGRSVVRSLMRTPVDGARVSSTFGMRFHPVLGFMKMHEGIDFAVPIGTPIYASGNAVVEWAAMKGPNGNLTILKHDDGRETYYLHQSKFEPGTVPGARVVQGQKIGEVGTTGRSTGPHLHYGMKVNGEWVDPAAVPVDEGKTLSGADLIAFGKVRDSIDLNRAHPTG